MDYVFLGSAVAALLVCHVFVKVSERREQRAKERFLELEREVRAEFEEDMPPALRMALEDAMTNGFGAYRQNPDGTTECIKYDEMYMAEKEQSK